MAYDAKDPDTIKAVKAAVDAAVAEASEEHETAVDGLKAKNTELLGKLKKAREGKGDPENVDKLESELEDTKAKLAKAEKDLGKTVKERDAFKTQAESESKAARDLVIETNLTGELLGANVKKEFMPAVKKLLADKVEVVVDGDKRSAMVAGKPLSEFVKSWSQSDEGKHYVSALANGGGNAPGGQANGNGGGRVVPYAEYAANPSAYAKDFASGAATLGPQTPA